MHYIGKPVLRLGRLPRVLGVVNEECGEDCEERQDGGHQERCVYAACGLFH